MKFPTMDEFAQNVAEKALDEYEYKGKTLRQWIEIISASELGTNLAEVGTDLATKRAVKGFPIDADLLMLKVEEEYGFRARDRLYEIIRYMPKYELPSAEPERVWSELDKQLIDALLRKIYELQGTSLSMDGVVAKKYYVNELYKVLFGRGEKPKWMI